MQPLFIDESLKNKTVAVAVSGGKDSMSLLHYTLSVKDKCGFNVVCLNIEHGIRGESSENDSLFVKRYCDKNGVPFIFYKINSLEKAKKEKLTVEQAARILRYECFFDAINSGKCDVVFTAHHLKDNTESVLLNLFRGTGIKGLCGIKNYDDKILRPFICVPEEEIAEYIKAHNIPFVTDETNLQDDYTRNYIRHNVIPAIEKVFPEAETCVLRLSETALIEDEFMDSQAEKAITSRIGSAEIRLPLHPALLRRAAVICLKHLGVTKDYEQVHIKDVCALAEKETGKSLDLPKGVTAIKEYDCIAFFKKGQKEGEEEIPFAVGKFNFKNRKFSVIRKREKPQDLTGGLYIDGDKIPEGAVIRSRRQGDFIKKFGGGTKTLSNYFSDLKIPRKERDDIPVIAIGNRILAIFKVSVSLDVKVDKKTVNVLKLIENKG